MSKGNRVLTLNLVLLASAIVVGLVVFEVGGRLLLERTATGDEVLLGVALPPRTVIPSESPAEVDPDEPYGDLVVGGKRITTSDLWGIARPDPVVGYVPQENGVSTNRWWRTNDVGARHDGDLLQSRPSPYGTSRWLFFGESFTQGSRLPQEDTWVYRLDKLSADWEAINFGVDGYGMAQSLLRYRMVADRLSHDAAVFVFLPTANLWRDVNTIRSLAEPWHSFAVLPRFLPGGDGLQLVASPYTDIQTLYRENHPRISPTLKSHLRQFDRFYVPILYESSGSHDFLIAARLLTAYLAKRQIKEIRRQTFYDPESEAWRTVREIFKLALSDAGKRQAKLVIVVMPTHDDVEAAADSEDYRNYWGEMVERLRQAGLQTVNLLPGLLEVVEDLDYGYDGSHYGPRASERIASILNEALSR